MALERIARVYFDISYKRQEIWDYIHSFVVERYLEELAKPENKNILDDVLAKTKFLGSSLAEQLTKEVAEYLRPKKNDVELVFVNTSDIGFGISKRFILDKRNKLEDELKKKYPGCTLPLKIIILKTGERWEDIEFQHSRLC